MEYPKWVQGTTKDEWGQEVACGLIVDSADQEQSVKDKTAIIATLKSAQGPTYKWVGVTLPPPVAMSAKK